MASTDPWRDFDQIRAQIGHRLTVDKLKIAIGGINAECSAGLSKTGKKQDLITRILSYMDSLRTARYEDKWQKTKTILGQVLGGSYSPQINPSVSLPVHGHTLPNFKYQINGHSATNGVRYDPYAPPAPTAPLASTSASTSSRLPTIESGSAVDRRQQTLTFTLNSDQLNKLKQTGSKYQLRLFCTSSVYYSSVNRNSAVPCPIEFPATCEVRVNGIQVTASLKGLKKKPGTAPPPDLAQYARLNSTANKIEMVYVNSQQPIQPKKYYLVVMLVEETTVERLVANLKATRRRSSQEIRQKMLSSMNDDDDIQAGPQKMSLKCPLTFMRVATPCRSSKCVHPQCFDATAWFQMMQQTTTYLCPTCEQILDHKELIIDGYFNEILQQTSDAVDDVIVEADGEWHTADNKYASPTWKATHPYARPSDAPASQPTRPPPEANGTQGDKGKQKERHEVYVLSDDDDDGDEVKREQSPSSYQQSLDRGSMSSQPPRSQSAIEDVIDLTVSDDEDDVDDVDDEPAMAPPPPVPVVPLVSLKRKAPEVDQPVTAADWKKLRSDTPEVHTPQHTHQHQSVSIQPLQQQQYRAPPVSSLDTYEHHYRPTLNAPPPTLPPPPTMGNLNGYSQPQHLSPYVNFPGRPSLTESRQLPPPGMHTNNYGRGPRWGGQ
ncbi:hypothetical protein FA15DRAFT_662259 [Coprinopsis marcescibilis]|uniref:PINIT domain-containing protein n=1 Tax=Coprinopsis marcescibilis TaxID=230819 RepID=A0A5C3LEE7_COPMA|nr:hypothetical protein FA15DRAFT_662259 [Coprinopsis marcescibilis]